ncbi:MoaD/ThiS family protein [Marivirga harenae]|uniref:MoaD/ThiS family protein n=1 Tax=Marivirga harenae TaxID=2010992 RepID=UPI0026DFED19|nr:MoaD/ThiS family protein [Marivirga harenae]WKV12438.1 MoaD/ThiS family protein [Marivirga harenae]|tara:strand:- start:95069 stop:95311 length:243 start_codon:yes stop_codon:yes gene_type:complete
MKHKIHIKYFGQIAEATNKTNEYLDVEKSSVEAVISQLNNSYPALVSQEFNVALDHKIVDRETEISKDVELALLPPFAGG